MKNKEIDAVKMMRDVREKLSSKYYSQPEMLLRDLEVIRKKYSLKQKSDAHKTEPE